MRRPREDSLCALCHFFNLIPVWGLIFCAWVWYALLEESRLVVFHARQAMAFHALALGVGLMWMVISLIGRILGVLSQSLADLLQLANNTVVTILTIAYVVACLWGCWCCLTGRPFRYPLVNRHAS